MRSTDMNLALLVVGMAIAGLPTHAPAFDLITNGLVAYYQLNGSGADSSGNGNNGTLSGTTLTTDRFGNSGGALYFANENDYVGITDTDLRFAATSFTISAWVRFDVFPTELPSYGTERDIVRRGNYVNYMLSTSPYTSNCAEFGFTEGGMNYEFARGSDGLNAGEWGLLTGVYDRSAGTLRLYVNGQLDSSLGGVADPYADDSYGNTTYIGNWVGTRIWQYPDFVGSIDDVLFYNRALSGPEVASLFDIPEPSTLAGIISFSLFAVGFMRRRAGNRRSRGSLTADCAD